MALDFLISSSRCLPPDVKTNYLTPSYLKKQNKTRLLEKEAEEKVKKNGSSFFWPILEQLGHLSSRGVMDPNVKTTPPQKTQSTSADAGSTLSGRCGESEKSLMATRLGCSSASRRADARRRGLRSITVRHVLVFYCREFAQISRATLESGAQPLAGKPLRRREFPCLSQSETSFFSPKILGTRGPGRVSPQWLLVNFHPL